MRILKEYGLKRSGTNYLKYLLMENFDCVVLGFIGGNKHRYIGEPLAHEIVTTLSQEEVDYYYTAMKNKEVDYIAIYKNPFAWINSYWVAYGKGAITDETVIELMQEYNDMNTHWSYHCYMVDYHKMINNPGEELNKIGVHFGLKRKAVLTEVELATRRASELFGEDLFTKGKRKRKFKKEYYDDKVYMNRFSIKQLSLIQSMDKFYKDVG